MFILFFRSHCKACLTAFTKYATYAIQMHFRTFIIIVLYYYYCYYLNSSWMYGLNAFHQGIKRIGSYSWAEPIPRLTEKSRRAVYYFKCELCFYTATCCTTLSIAHTYTATITNSQHMQEFI